MESAISAMEQHPAHPEVQRTGCGFFRALSYDAECCGRLRRSRAVSTVADSIRRNPNETNVLVEGR